MTIKNNSEKEYKTEGCTCCGYPSIVVKICKKCNETQICEDCSSPNVRCLNCNAIMEAC